MPPTVQEFISTLKARLEALNIERNQIIALLATHGENVGATSPSLGLARVQGMPSHYQVPVFPPVPESEKIVLKKDHNGRTGITPVIVKVAELHPGLDITQLANRILDYVTGDVPSSRDGLRNMIKYAVDTKRLVKRDHRYYVPRAKTDTA